MSMESAKAFYIKLEGDTVLARRLQEISNEEREMLVKGELGYDFTPEEMQEVIFEKNPSLTDDDLEAVVGGISVAEDAGMRIGLLGGMGAGVLVGSTAASAAAA